MPLVQRWKFFDLTFGGYARGGEQLVNVTIRRSGALTADLIGWRLTVGHVQDTHRVAAYLGNWRATGLHYWLYQEVVYSTDDPALTPDDVDALVNEQANRRRLQIERAKAVRAMSEQVDHARRRERIPQEVRIAVWQRDGGRCVECGHNSELEFDHIIPLAMGGSNTERNLQLLCGPCNRRKGATLG